MEIDFRLDGACKLLSNLYPHEFVFRDHKCMGMEPLLMSIKYPEVEEQLFILENLHGFDAKKYGKKKPWWEKQELYWLGEPMDRHSEVYKNFLIEAYSSLFEQNDLARQTLIDTGRATLKHSIGGTNPTRTILTRTEFCVMLTQHRMYYQSQEFVEYDGIMK